MASNDDTTSGGGLSAERARSRADLVGAFATRTVEESVPELLPYLSAGASVLDVGCGPGSITMDVARAVAPGEVLGVEPAEDRVASASRDAKEAGIDNVSFRVGDAHTLDMPDNSFDVVYSNTVMHFFIDPVKALKEQKRVAKDGGWVIASGVRDYGFSPRYPACPNVDAVWDAYVRYNDSLRERHNAGGQVAMPRDRAVPELSYIDLHTGRKCSEWFTEAGLTNLTMDLKIEKWLHPGADRMQPFMLDLVPEAGDSENPWLDAQGDIIAAGILDEETIDRARQELAAWYVDPRAFAYSALLFVAGKA